MATATITRRLTHVSPRHIWGHGLSAALERHKRRASLRLNWPFDRLEAAAGAQGGTPGHVLVMVVPWVRFGLLPKGQQQAEPPKDPVEPLQGLLLAVEEFVDYTHQDHMTAYARCPAGAVYLEGSSTAHGASVTLVLHSKDGRHRWDAWRRASDWACRRVATTEDHELLRACLCTLAAASHTPSEGLVFGWKVSHAAVRKSPLWF
jgi:hypothetical protein